MFAVRVRGGSNYFMKNRDKMALVFKANFMGNMHNVRIPVDCDRHSDLIATAVPA